MENNIYLDNAATTEPSKEVVLAMNETLGEVWGNPSSIHSVGAKAKTALDEARQNVADFIGCEFDEVIFTSGGSEANNLALRGVITAIINYQLPITNQVPISKLQNNQINNSNLAIEQLNNVILPHIITTATEHHSVLHTIQDLEKAGTIEATYLKPDSEGLITPAQVVEAIKDNTVLVSIIYVNNETGVAAPIQGIGENLRIQNTEYRIQQGLPKIFFHTDAVQAAEYFRLDPEFLGVDMLTFTGHKIHGPRGAGVLFVKKGTRISHEITGGDQEFRLRAGTENVAAIVGLSRAVDLIGKEREGTIHLESGNSMPELIMTNEAETLITLRDKLINKISESIPDAILNGSREKRTPNIVNVSFLNAEGEAIILNLDFLGIQVSSGSACTSRSLDPSHVLSAMGIPPEKAHGSIRFSLSRYTTEEEIDKVLEVLPGVIQKLREMSPFK